MRSAREAWLTIVLCGACAALGFAELWPRLATQRVALVFEAPEIEVAIAGAVREPGTYALPFGATVADLLAEAGGLTADAAKTLVNQADPLTAGEMIVVPSAVTSSGERRIDVNSASLLELETLPGIGPVTAARITEGRPFASFEDLLDVPGIGPKTLGRLKPLVGL